MTTSTSHPGPHHDNPTSSHTASRTAEDAAQACRTRPGTPMIGRYSVAQMDDFYAAFARGEVKPTGVMNLLQRLHIAQACRDGDRVLDVCCGRGLQLPVLARYRPGIAGYVGLDISPDNLAEAHTRLAAQPAPFPVSFHEADVALPWPVTGAFDVAIYTSALEHLPQPQGAESLCRTAAALTTGGRLFLSTPNTPGDPPRPLQHRVHVYEWSHPELTAVLDEIGLQVEEVIGILPPPDPAALVAAVEQRFGAGGAALYAEMARHAPPALLGPVVSTAVDTAASEVLYVCSKRGTR